MRGLIHHIFQTILITFCAALGIAFAGEPSDWSSIDLDRVEGTTLHFKSTAGSAPSPMKTNLHELSYLGTLRPSGPTAPWFLFKGKPCQNCSAEPWIYAIRPTDSRLVSFVYPGRVLEAKSRQMTLEARAFYGKCVRDRGDVYVVFQKERIEKKRKGGGKSVRQENSVFVAEAGPDHLIEKLYERGLPRFNDTLARVKSKQCKEIDGRNRLTSNRPIVPGPWNDTGNGGTPDLSDDDEDAPEGTPASSTATDAPDAPAPAAEAATKTPAKE